MQSWMRTIVISQGTGMQKDQQVFKPDSNSFQILLFFLLVSLNFLLVLLVYFFILFINNCKTFRKIRA